MPGRGDAVKASRSRTRLSIIATTALALVLAASGCSAIGGGSEPTSSGTPGGPVEKPAIKVGVLPVVDMAPFFVAVDSGYFKQEGLDVQVVTAPSGPKAIESLIGGDLDIAVTSYPGAFAAQAKKAADIKIVTDLYAARPGHGVLVSKGKITKPEDAAGKKIAVTSTGSISDLALKSVLQPRIADINTIKWVPMPLPDMGPALERGDIDGAVVIEPFVTLTEKSIGAMPVIDIASGPTAELPMSGFASLAKWVTANPNTAAAFQRGLAKGIKDVKSDRGGKLEPVLIKYVKIDAATAPLVHISDYPESLDPIRLQRVADLMLKFGAIKEPLDVSKMVVAPPSNK
ncbi:NitT/TauT family transport system substrate-binding protein [Kibdelosporangium banguiense]|uniref:NitT/TauT family transport system substrate-binding protein n=1 Tax=Kibdelosporangium banguiense TaxID=1365924 RepID=A0ABS4U237_9PSEU|nr:ABC transporter substrate-binding protein [Kibdelosporangium banguiense]MBP2330685.1 NitT/TauT family transport system substrate-binding protein [Kibdelosporangium banguiense]